MSFEIGGLPPIQPPPAARREVDSHAAAVELPRVDTAELSLPADPPAEVLDEVGAAAARAEALALADRELHFRVDEETGRVVIEARDLDGNVIRTSPRRRRWT
jgi:hypothetical protein